MEEGDGGDRLGSSTEYLAGIALHAARQVDRQAGDLPGIHGFDDGPRRALERSRQAGAEEGVDR